MFSSISRVASSRLSTTALKTTKRLTAKTATSSRFFSSLALPGTLQGSQSRWKWAVGSGIAATTALQLMYGNTSDFYEYRFITDKDPDDIASFYGGEEFMELFCVMPIVGQIMMRGGTFDDEGTVHTQGLPGRLEVSMVFSDEFDSEKDQTLWFNKRERFKDVFYEKKMWDMVTNFGFQTLPDGRVECYHTGEYFHGNIPPLSLLLRLIFQIHAQYVGWATENFINSVAFTSETDEEEVIEEEARTFFLWHLVKNVYWDNAKAMVFGRKKAPARRDSVHEDDEAEEKDLSDILNRPSIAHTRTVAIQPMLTIQRHSTLSQINEDIRADRALLRQNSMKGLEVKSGVEAYRRATVAARQRFETRRRMSTVISKKD